MNTLAERLRLAMAHAGATQSQLAHRVGVSQWGHTKTNLRKSSVQRKNRGYSQSTGCRSHMVKHW